MILEKFYILFLSLVLFSNCFSSKSGQKSTEIEAKSVQDKHLLARIIAIEDRLEILNLLAGSPFSSDVASEAYWTKMFTEDAVLDVGKGRPLTKGRDELLKIVGGPDQRQAINFGMTHLAMLPHITLNGDSAVATGYLLITVPDSAASHVKLPSKGVSQGFSIYQLTVNRWELIRTTDGWKVSNRTVRPITNDDSRYLLVRAIEGSK